jgi:dTMP kinase
MEEKINNNNFIVFEGGEASGKSTQIKLLSKLFSLNNLDNITTREPGGTLEAELIRNIVLNNNLDNLSNLLLFVASRRENLINNVIPQLNKKNIVICDRYLLSSIVYQCVVNNISIDLIVDLHKKYNFNLFPALTFVFDCNVDVALKRMEQRGVLSNFDAKSRDFHEKINLAYQTDYDFYESKIINIDSNQSFEKIHLEIIKAVEKHFNIVLKLMNQEQIEQCLV